MKHEKIEISLIDVTDHHITDTAAKQEYDLIIVDTPGIKEFGLIQYSKEEIRDYFPEIRAYNNKCKFDDCSHTHEPGCAVHEAVERGDIAESRYQNYLAILLDDDMKLADWQLE